VQAVNRLDGLVPPERIVILTSPSLADQIAGLLPQVPRAQIFGEPRAASTAPALVWAADWISHQDPGAHMLSLHADWAVGATAPSAAPPARPGRGGGIRRPRHRRRETHPQ
jgi:mannose-1-phosphate guanylyltransferase